MAIVAPVLAGLRTETVERVGSDMSWLAECRSVILNLPIGRRQAVSGQRLADLGSGFSSEPGEPGDARVSEADGGSGHAQRGARPP